jgi:large repetitive protein
VNFTITPKPVTITPDSGQSKVYGETDPTLTFTNNGGLTASDFTGALARAAGENVGTYAINLGTLSAGSNYNLTLRGDEVTFAITPKSVTVTPDSGQSKVFGDDDPVLTYALSEDISVTGALARAAGGNVGTYAINLGTLAAASSNYQLVLSSTTVNFTITPKPVTITPDSGQSKVYGAADPTLTFANSAGLAAGAFTGALSREGGQNVGTYVIGLGTLTAGDNYSLSLHEDEVTFAITARPITVTAAPKSKEYGDDDPALTYSITTGTLVNGDSLSGDLTRDAGEDVGQYDINQGSLSAGSNYELTFVGAKLTITKRAITVTADAKSKVYGEDDPALTYQVTSGSLLDGDSLSGALTRVAGNEFGTYAIQQGTLSAGENYNLTFVGANLSITKRPITVTADAKSKLFGASDPPLTYTVTSSITPAMIGSDGFTGSLTRVAGETVGSYAIQKGSLEAGSNYAITYVGANLTITAWNAQGHGFYQPVGVANSVFVAGPGALPAANSTTVYNVAKGGSTIPLKFNVFAGTVEKTSTADISGFTAVKLSSCSAGAGMDEVDFVTSGNTERRYDPVAGQWIQNWKTPSVSSDACYRASVTFADGSSLSAFFRLRK